MRSIGTKAILSLLIASSVISPRMQAAPSPTGVKMIAFYTALVWGGGALVKSTLPTSWQKKLSLENLERASKITIRVCIGAGAASLGLSFLYASLLVPRTLRAGVGAFKEINPQWLAAVNRYAAIAESPEKRAELAQTLESLPEAMQESVAGALSAARELIQSARDSVRAHNEREEGQQQGRAELALTFARRLHTRERN